MIKELSTMTELEKGFGILKELRTHLSFEDFCFLYQKAHEKDGYRLYSYTVGEKSIAVMGTRVLYDFVHGKHLYIDDLVVTETSRGKGMGAKLLQFAEQLAQKEGCERLRLCTGIENERGIEFYLKQGWEKRAHAFKKPTPGTLLGPNGPVSSVLV